jgi:chemotaxis protein MotB
MDELTPLNLITVVGLVVVVAGMGVVGGWVMKQTIDQQEQDKTLALRKTVKSLERQNRELRQRLNIKARQLKNQERQTRDLVRSLNKKLEESDVRSKKGIVTVKIPNRILFEEASAEIKSQDLEVLKDISSTLKEYPNRETRIQGHADTKPLHPDAKYESNWELSSQRAVNVVKNLVYGHDIDRTRIGAVGFAQYRPLTQSSSDEDQAKNRRVEVVLYPEGYVD